MTSEKKIEKQNRRAMKEGLQKMIVAGLTKKYGNGSPNKIKAMAKQMAQGKHPAMGINW